MPGATSTYAAGINASGQIVGSYLDSASGRHAFLWSGGQYTKFDVPGGGGTVARGINDLGQIVGQYDTASDLTYGFLLSDGVYTTINVPGSLLTIAEGINDFGQIVGWYRDSSEIAHGFLATPIPEPATLVLLAIGTLGVIAWAWCQGRGTIARHRSSSRTKAGKGEDALLFAEGIKGRYTPAGTRNEVLRETALYYVRKGNLKEARRALDSISDADYKVRLLAGIVYLSPASFDLPSEPGMALLQDQAGKRAGARQTLKVALEVADQIKDAARQAQERAAVVCALAQIGDLADAQKTLTQISPDSKGYPFALVAIAKGQAKAGQEKAARQTIDHLKEASQQVYGLAQVAAGQAEAGDLKSARVSGEKALKLLLSLPERDRRSALHVLASLRAKAKDFEGALETASHITGPGDRAIVTYHNIAYYQAKAGDVKGAMGTLKAHLPEDAWWYDRALQAIASVQAERGEEKEALSWTNELMRHEARGYALLGVAKGLMERNKIHRLGTPQ